MNLPEDPPLHLVSRHWELLRHLLLSHVPDLEVWAFGSRVTGQAHDGSDLDLVVRDPAGLEHKSTHAIRQLRSAFEESSLPILVDVLDWAAIPEHFRSQIEKNYLRIHPGV